MTCLNCKFFKEHDGEGHCNLLRGPVDRNDEACASKEQHTGGRI